MSTAAQLEALRDEVLEKLDEMKVVMRDAPSHIHERAKAYWLPHVEMALTKEHGYCGGSMVDCQDTINELREEEEMSDSK